MVEIRRVDSVDRFTAAAGAFLVAREAEHNLMLGICSSLQALAADDAPTDDLLPAFFVGSSGDRVVLAALRTPPRNLVLSEVDEAAGVQALDALADALAGDDLPGNPGRVPPTGLCVGLRGGRESGPA